MPKTEPHTLPFRPCVGIMLLSPSRRIWIGRRSDSDPHRYKDGGWWQMPQGGIHAGEDAAAAALRELHEETGIRSASIIAENPGWLTYDLPNELQGKIWGGRYRGQKQKWFAAQFTGTDAEIDLAHVTDQRPEFDAWRWADIGEIVDLIVPFKRDVYRQVFSEFGHLVSLK